ncbi:hypothetical protein O9992_21900 [Vibrio lentus]|nr:hypothetical protein [Vibrio lentus]
MHGKNGIDQLCCDVIGFDKARSKIPVNEHFSHQFRTVNLAVLNGKNTSDFVAAVDEINTLAT